MVDVDLVPYYFFFYKEEQLKKNDGKKLLKEYYSRSQLNQKKVINEIINISSIICPEHSDLKKFAIETFYHKLLILNLISKQADMTETFSKKPLSQYNQYLFDSVNPDFESYKNIKKEKIELIHNIKYNKLNKVLVETNDLYNLLKKEQEEQLTLNFE